MLLHPFFQAIKSKQYALFNIDLQWPLLIDEIAPIFYIYWINLSSKIELDNW